MFKARSKSELLAWGCGICCAGLLFMTALFIFGSAMIFSRSTTNHPDLNRPEIRIAMEKQLGVKFPETVQWLGCRVNHWQDMTVYLACRMPKREIPEMLPGKRLNWMSSDSMLTSGYSIKERWFKPETVRQYKAVEIEHPRANSYLRILYDDSVGSDTLTSVYIEWFDI